jgi:protein SCO1/2
MMRALLLGLLAWHAAAWSATQPPDAGRTQFDPALTRVDESRHLGQALDRATHLVDENGRSFRVGELLGKPTILVLSYFGCDGACPTINRNLANALDKVQRFKLGRDYQVLTVSFDPQDEPAQAAKFLQSSAADPSSAEGWRFAVLADRQAESIKAFADQVGFNYFWSRADKMFVHPNVLVFLTPEGRVARYIYGTQMDAQNLELALIDADWGRISEGGALFDIITGACYSFSYSDGRYHPNYALLIGVASLLFGLSLMALGAIGYRRKLARRLVHAH